jgi:hypothetical protein
MGFRPARFGPPIFSEANLNPHYWPFKGIVWSIVVHASIFTALVFIPAIDKARERPSLQDEAIVIEPDELKDVLYLPVLGANVAKSAPEADAQAQNPAPPGKEGLSYPGPQPVISNFPKVTSHIQTVLQPGLVNPPVLEPSLAFPNLVRLAAPAVEPRFKVPDAVTSQVRPPIAPIPQLDVALTGPARPLAAPVAEARFKSPDAANPVARPSLTMPAVADVSLTGPTRPLAAPIAEARFKLPDAANPVARPSLTAPASPTDVSLSGPMRPLAAPVAEPKFKLPDAVYPVARPALTGVTPTDISLTAQLHPLAAPAAEPRFKLPDPVAPISRPTLTVPVGPTEIPLSGPAKPLAAPLAESRFKVTEAAAPTRQQANPNTSIVQVDLPTGPARPLSAPVAESKFKAPEAAAAPTVRPSTMAATTPMDVSLAGPTRPLAAPRAEPKFKTTETEAAPTARPNTTATTTPIDVSLAGPARPLAAPRAEPKFKATETEAPTAARPATAGVSPVNAPPLTPLRPLGPPAPPNSPTQNLLTLSPTPASRDQQVVVPPGESRGQFAISPQPNLTFPGTDPGGKVGAGTANASAAANSIAVLVTPAPSSNAGNNAGASSANGSVNTAGARPSPDTFPGITILSGGDAPGTSRNSAPNTQQANTEPPPLQTSYGIMILASGRSGGGLPDFGVFSNEQVHTVYLDMRKTVQDTPITWTAEFGIPPKPATAESERVTAVGSQQEILLPFPITKERPAMPAALVRKYPDRMVIAYAVVTTEGKMEQLSIKQSPDPQLNELVLSALRKWTFRPGRRDGEIVAAKVLLGIPLHAN